MRRRCLGGGGEAVGQPEAGRAEQETFGMWSFSPTALALIALTFVLAGVVKGVTGMGLPTVSVGVLGAFMPPVSAASLLLIPSFVTNVWQLVTGPDFRALVARLWTMMLGVIIGTIVGVRLLTGANSKWTTIALGVALAAYALYSLLARPLSVPKRIEAWLSPAIGLVTGLISGATGGVFVIPSVPYLQGLQLEKDDLIQALGLSFTVSTVALAIGLASNGAFHLGDLALSALAIIPALIGMWIGAVIRERISAKTFRFGFLCCLGVLGVELAGRSLLWT